MKTLVLALLLSSYSPILHKTLEEAAPTRGGTYNRRSRTSKVFDFISNSISSKTSRVLFKLLLIARCMIQSILFKVSIPLFTNSSINDHSSSDVLFQVVVVYCC